MAEVHQGRFTADVEGDFVVFLIGMRVNNLLNVRGWGPVAAAMPKMLKMIDRHPELGCLGYHQWVGRTTMMLQYWRDFESLDRFARDESLPHLEPWRRFNKALRHASGVGVWHETYQVRADDYEVIYTNMPAFGLAKATTHVPLAKRGQSAAARIGASAVDSPAVPPPAP
jgi:hypothetical protein